MGLKRIKARSELPDLGQLQLQGRLARQFSPTIMSNVNLEVLFIACYYNFNRLNRLICFKVMI